MESPAYFSRRTNVITLPSPAGRENEGEGAFFTSTVKQTPRFARNDNEWYLADAPPWTSEHNVDDDFISERRMGGIAFLRNSDNGVSGRSLSSNYVQPMGEAGKPAFKDLPFRKNDPLPPLS